MSSRRVTFDDDVSERFMNSVTPVYIKVIKENEPIPVAESTQDEIISLMTLVLESQSLILERLDKMESGIRDLQTLHKKIYKQICAPCVLEPVAQFKRGGYKDWTIKPVLQAKVAPPSGSPCPTLMPMIPSMPPMLSFPFPPPPHQFVIHGTAIEQQDRSRNPGVAPRTPVDKDDDILILDSSTPAYGTKTPIYEDHSPESVQNSRATAPKSKFTSSSGRNRYKPYDNKHSQTRSNTAPARPESPYEPKSPIFL